MKISLDQDKCVASGQCVMTADQVFDQRDEDGIAVLLNHNPPAAQAPENRARGGRLPRTRHHRRGLTAAARVLQL